MISNKLMYCFIRVNFILNHDYFDYDGIVHLKYQDAFCMADKTRRILV